MAEAVLTLKMNPKTGERILMINYESNPDALSYEHEDDHRAFVESILGQPLHQIADRLEVRRSPPHPLTQTQTEVEQNHETPTSIREGEER